MPLLFSLADRELAVPTSHQPWPLTPTHLFSSGLGEEAPHWMLPGNTWTGFSMRDRETKQAAWRIPKMFTFFMEHLAQLCLLALSKYCLLELDDHLYRSDINVWSFTAVVSENWILSKVTMLILLLFRCHWSTWTYLGSPSSASSTLAPPWPSYCWTKARTLQHGFSISSSALELRLRDTKREWQSAWRTF